MLPNNTTKRSSNREKSDRQERPGENVPEDGDGAQDAAEEYLVEKAEQVKEGGREEGREEVGEH